MNRMRCMPTRVISSTTYCTTGLRPTGSISLGCDLVAGRSRVPSPATGTTARLTGFIFSELREHDECHNPPQCVNPLLPIRLGGNGGKRVLKELAGSHETYDQKFD